MSEFKEKLLAALEEKNPIKFKEVFTEVMTIKKAVKVEGVRQQEADRLVSTPKGE